MTKNVLVSAIEWVYANSSSSDLVLAVLGFFVFSCLREKLTNRGGPISWPVLGITATLYIHINNLFEWSTEALIKSGGTFSYRGVWFGGSFGIVTADASNIEYMLRTNFKNFPKGEYYRERFRDLLEDGIFNADGELWKEQRWIAKSEMHSSRFLEHSFQNMQDLVHNKLMKLMESMVSSGKSFDLQEILLRFTFDNICISAFGVDPGSLAPDLPEIPFAKAFEEATEYSLFRFFVPPFVWKPMRYFGVGYEKKLKRAVEIVHAFSDKTVRERRIRLKKLGTLNDHSDLLSRLMQIEHDKRSGNNNMESKLLSDKYFREFCTSFIIAGRDTTSVALLWFFWLVQKHPEVENKILREIKDVITKRKKSKTQESEIPPFTAEELKNMVYLQAALSESLRLYPSVPLEMKQVQETDVLPDGTVVKKGARVHYSVYSMGRMESIWGKDCGEFRPERWIKDGRLVSEDQFKYVVFNAGPRLCIGKRFGYMQMKMVAASVLLRYSIKVVEGQVVVPKLNTTLYMKNGLMVNLKTRVLDID